MTTTEIIEFLLYQERLKYYSSVIMTFMPFLQIGLVLLHLLKWRKTFCILAVVIGILTFSIPNEIYRAAGIAVTLLAIFTIVIEAIKKKSDTQDDG